MEILRTFFAMKNLRTFLEEEGEETRPPVGKDINRPPFPNHSPPCRYDDHASFRVTRHSRVVTSFSRGRDRAQHPRVGDVILAW